MIYTPEKICSSPAMCERWVHSCRNRWWWFCRVDVGEFLHNRETTLDCQTSWADQRRFCSTRGFVLPVEAEWKLICLFV